MNRHHENYDEEALNWPPFGKITDQANLWFSGRPYDWQHEILLAFEEDNARVIVSTNNEAGKTSEIIPTIGLSIMNAFPGSQILSTAGVERQVKDQLFRALEQKLRPFPHWHVARDSMKIQGPDVNGLRSSWLGYVPKDAITAEGFHSGMVKNTKGEWCRTLCIYIVDEAKTAKEELFEAVERINPDMRLAISTPGNTEGPFYEGIDQDGLDVGKTDDIWSYRNQIDYSMCPHLMKPYNLRRIDRLIKKHGVESPFIQSMFFGRFANESALFVFGDYLNQIRKAMSGTITGQPGKRKAALEFSGGGDEQTIAIAQGTTIIHWEQYRMKDTDALAKKYVEVLRKFEVEPQDVTADNGGIGKAIVDNMEGMGYRGIYRYMFNAEPMNKAEYADRASEDHFEFRELLKSGAIPLPDDSVLLQQMRERKFQLDDNNRVKLEPKKLLRKRGKQSPDRLDTLIMLYSGFAPVEVKERPKNLMTEGPAARGPYDMESTGMDPAGYFGGMICEE